MFKEACDARSPKHHREVLMTEVALQQKSQMISLHGSDAADLPLCRTDAGEQSFKFRRDDHIQTAVLRFSNAHAIINTKVTVLRVDHGSIDGLDGVFSATPPVWNASFWCALWHCSRQSLPTILCNIRRVHKDL